MYFDKNKNFLILFKILYEVGKHLVSSKVWLIFLWRFGWKLASNEWKKNHYDNALGQLVIPNYWTLNYLITRTSFFRDPGDPGGLESIQKILWLLIVITLGHMQFDYFSGSRLMRSWLMRSQLLLSSRLL